MAKSLRNEIVKQIKSFDYSILELQDLTKIREILRNRENQIKIEQESGNK